MKYISWFLKRKILTFLFVASSQAQEYPFNGLPDTVQVTLEVSTSETETFNNKLLGYNISKFTSPQEKELIRKFDPITIRFPQGIFSNWYTWRDDTYEYYTPWPYNHEGDVIREKSLTPGVAGLEDLNNEQISRNQGEGYDFLITWNMSADGQDWGDNTDSLARFNHYEDIGFGVRAIEMGNELFYRNQRSPIIPSETEYLLRAKSLSSAIKAINPDVKFSIPLITRGSATNPNWNRLLTEDQSYFDAVTVHKYVGANPDDRDDLSRIAYEYALAGRLELISGVSFATQFVPEKPVWLTEWAVKAGDSRRGNAASCLGMADCYIYLSESQETFERANWFNANRGANQHVLIEEGTANNVVYPFQKTGYGLTYDVIRSVFEDSKMLAVEVHTASKLRLAEGELNAVSARAVVKQGKTLVFAVNLTDRPVEFRVNIDGVPYNDSYRLEAVKYEQLSDERIIPFDSNPFNHDVHGAGLVELPPLSINRITLAINVLDEEAVVEAGPDQTLVDVDLDGKETVVLEGFATLEGLSIDYVWTKDGYLLGEGATLEVDLEFGSHEITLTADNGVSSLVDTLEVTIVPPSPEDAAMLLLGWEKWKTLEATVAEGAMGVAALGEGWAITFTGSSGDGSFGSISSPAADTGNSVVEGDGLSLNASEGEILFTLRSSIGLRLAGFHFDAARRGGELATYKLEVLEGSAISAGTVSSGELVTTFGADFQDIDVDLSSLADRELQKDEEVAFKLSFAGLSTRLDFDNVGVSGIPTQLAWGYPDNDGDGIPDYWELRYFGDLSGSGATDADRDGASDYAEFIFGTDPTDSGSRFQFRIEKADDGKLDLVWTNLSGRLFRVYTRSHLSEGVWELLESGLKGKGADSDLRYRVLDGDAFYRIEVIRL